MTKVYDLVPPPVKQVYKFEPQSKWAGVRVWLGVTKWANGIPFRLKVKAMKLGGKLAAAWAMQREGKREERANIEKYVPK